MRKLILVLALVVASAGMADAAFAQAGKISGRVVDPSGDPLPGVNVVIIERWVSGNAVSTSEPQGSATGADGYYTILNVSPGTYNLRASFIGYTPVVQTEIVVQTGLTSTVDFVLAEEVYEGEEVEIVAQRDVVRPDIAGTVEYISPERMTQAPTTRVDEFVGKIKGVELVSTAEGNGLQIRGGSIRETDVRMDGMSMRDPRSGQSNLSFNSSVIEEIQVKTGGFEARYGGLQSGLVNVVTKEGSRDRFTASFRADYAPAGQKRYFGTGAWEPGSPLYETFAGEYAMTGVPDSMFIREGNPNGWIPDESPFRNFLGWQREGLRSPIIGGLTGEEKRAYWLATHPAFEVATRPDYFMETAITGPFILPKTTFLFGLKYEDTQFAFPLGPRDNYEDWNAQFKLTTRFAPGTKLSANFMTSNISTINTGQTSSYGGAVLGQTDRFNFLTNTRSSVTQQASLIGSSWGYQNMYNVGRTQYYDERTLMGGLTFTHAISPTAYFNLEAQATYRDNTISPFMFDTEGEDAYFRIGTKEFLNMPRLGYPNGNVTPVDDYFGTFRLVGGANASDSSYTWQFGLRGDITKQLGRHHQLEAGFEFGYDRMFVYSGINRSTTFAYEPGFFQYYTATPIDAALFFQDKLEYEGMVATIGVRADYFNPMRHGYDVSLPLDDAFRDMYGSVYHSLPGAQNSYERWIEWRELLAEPPGWPKVNVPGKLRISPRIGTSFPITTSSKLYFNYGIMYQRPNAGIVYNQVIQTGRVIVPAPHLDPEKTTAFEFGYEQSLFNNYVLNGTFYYKDVQNKPLSVKYYSYFEDNIVDTYFNEAYADIRGVELRVEKNVGRFFTFWGNYDYQVYSSGSTGIPDIYEDPIKAREEERTPDMFRAQARPRAYFSANIHTPNNFGPEILGNYPIGGIYINPLYEWREGGYMLWNPNEANPDLQQRVDIVDYQNVDLRVSKTFNVPQGNLELLLTIQNVLNTKRLATGNMTQAQLGAYRNSLKLPHKGGEDQGNDKWGEWDKEHIDVGWYTAPLFLNPRRFILGVRMQF